MTYALNTLGRMVSIKSVDRGLKCDCFCPKCKERLIAKQGKEGGRQPHFAHMQDSECHGAYMTAIHRMAQQIIQEKKVLMVPEYSIVKAQKLEFTNVELEKRVERKDLQPDIVAETEDGKRWFIEIRNTHEVDDKKKSKIVESGITCLEIDVREQQLESLESFILTSSDQREWINNTNYDQLIIEELRKRVARVSSLFVENQELMIPANNNIYESVICLHDVSIKTSEDGLLSEVKAVSKRSKTPYVFIVGTHDSIKQVNMKKECNELCVFVDDLSFDIEIQLKKLVMQWMYHYVSFKEKPSKNQVSTKKNIDKLLDYISNPNFEVKKLDECRTQCKYKPVGGKCVYLTERLSDESIDFIICNKRKRVLDENEFVEKKNNSSDNQRMEYRRDPQKYAEAITRTTNNIIQKELTIPFDFNSSEDPVSINPNIDNYYSLLKTDSFYETGDGVKAELLKASKNIDGNKIIVAYKDSGNESKGLPYHVAFVFIENGILKKNKVADFTSEKKALRGLAERLNN